MITSNNKSAPRLLGDWLLSRTHVSDLPILQPVQRYHAGSSIGTELADLYDSVSHQFIVEKIHGTVQIKLPPDAARLFVVIPSNGISGTNEHGHTTMNDIVIDYY